MEYITAGRLKAAFHRGMQVLRIRGVLELNMRFRDSIRAPRGPETVRVVHNPAFQTEPYVSYHSSRRLGIHYFVKLLPNVRIDVPLLTGHDDEVDHFREYRERGGPPLKYAGRLSRSRPTSFSN